jgi:hypothetical protein
VDREGRLNFTGASLLTEMVDNLIVTAPNGNEYRITVDDSGNLTTEPV